MRPENHDFRKMPIKHTENTQEHSGLLYESPGGNQVDGLPPVAHNATRVKKPGLRPDIYMATGVFARVVLMIQPSDRRKNFQEPRTHA